MLVVAITLPSTMPCCWLRASIRFFMVVLFVATLKVVTFYMYSGSGSVQDSLHKNLAFVRSVRRIVVAFRVAVMDLQLHFF
jgi:hypothetical protein